MLTAEDAQQPAGRRSAAHGEGDARGRGPSPQAARRAAREPARSRGRCRPASRDLTERFTPAASSATRARRRVAEAEEAGTRKGLTFEERVHDALERIADARGDCATHTGDEGAEGGGKKGDTAGRARRRRRPVAADGSSSRPRTRGSPRTTPGASSTRRWPRAPPSFAVLVVAGEDRIPAGREQLHEYEGNKMIVAVDRDEPGLPGARASPTGSPPRASRWPATATSTVDAAEVRAATEEALSTPQAGTERSGRVPDRHQDLLRPRAHRTSRRWSPIVELKL